MTYSYEAVKVTDLNPVYYSPELVARKIGEFVAMGLKDAFKFRRPSHLGSKSAHGLEFSSNGGFCIRLRKS